jgi:hypothetical protein
MFQADDMKWGFDNRFLIFLSKYKLGHSPPAEYSRDIKALVSIELRVGNSSVQIPGSEARIQAAGSVYSGNVPFEISSCNASSVLSDIKVSYVSSSS